MRWHKTRCLTSIRQNVDLGINNDDAEFRPCVIDLDEIESYMDDETHENEPCTQVKFKSGESFSIEEPFDDFVAVMKSLG